MATEAHSDGGRTGLVAAIILASDSGAIRSSLAYALGIGASTALGTAIAAARRLIESWGWLLSVAALVAFALLVV
jgi:hypothetical protein